LDVFGIVCLVEKKFVLLFFSEVLFWVGFLVWGLLCLQVESAFVTVRHYSSRFVVDSQEKSQDSVSMGVFAESGW